MELLLYFCVITLMIRQLHIETRLKIGPLSDMTPAAQSFMHYTVPSLENIK